MSRASTLFRSAALGALTLASWAGCAGPPPPELEPSLRARFIAEEPVERLELDELPEPLPVGLGARAYKVELDHEVRNAYATLPGWKGERRVTPAAGSELRAAVGTIPGGGTLAFRALADPRGDEPVLLAELRVGPGDDGADGGVWHELRADLSPFAGSQVTVRLETVVGADSAPAEGPDRGLGFWADPRVVTPMEEGPAGEGPTSVLLISIDTLRADHLSLYGYPRPTSPNLDRWAREHAAVFRRVVAPSPWTLPSHVSILSGLDAVRHRFNHDVGGAGTAGSPEASFDTLAAILRRAGYATAAATGGAYMHPKFGFDRGFDRYRYWPDRRRSARELADGVDRALAFLAEHRAEPCLFFLHSYDVHDPYRARRPYFSRVAPPGLEAPPGRIALESPENEPGNGFQQVNRFVLRHGGDRRILDVSDRSLIEAFYDSGVAHMDAQIGRLFEGLEELGLARSTLVVFTSDHGEALGKDGEAGHVYLKDHNLLVPLLIATPDRLGAGREIGEQVRSVDVLPTILDLLGLDSRTSMDGVSLVDLMAGRPSPVPPWAWSYSAAANRGLSLRLDDRVKYVRNNAVWPPLPGREQLYDLRQDPGEGHDLAPGDPRLPALRERMLDYWAAAPGLRLRIANPGPGTLAGELAGAMVRPVGTKSPELAAPLLRWREMGRAELEVPPGASFTVHFEKIFGRRLDLSGTLEGEGGEEIPFRHTFTVDDLEGVEALVFDDGRWRSRAFGGLGAASELDRLFEERSGFAVWWQGPRAAHERSPAESDAELQRQLEALGYL